jgi:hypothetical protein
MTLWRPLTSRAHAFSLSLAASRWRKYEGLHLNISLPAHSPATLARIAAYCGWLSAATADRQHAAAFHSTALGVFTAAIPLSRAYFTAFIGRLRISHRLLGGANSQILTGEAIPK